jgi:hypothetical protein
MTRWLIFLLAAPIAVAKQTFLEKDRRGPTLNAKNATASDCEH